MPDAKSGKKAGDAVSDALWSRHRDRLEAVERKTSVREDQLHQAQEEILALRERVQELEVRERQHIAALRRCSLVPVPPEHDRPRSGTRPVSGNPAAPPPLELDEDVRGPELHLRRRLARVAASPPDTDEGMEPEAETRVDELCAGEVNQAAMLRKLLDSLPPPAPKPRRRKRTLWLMKW